MKSVMVMTDGDKIMYSPTVYIEHAQDHHDEDAYVFYVYNDKTRTSNQFQTFKEAHRHALGELCT